MATDIIPATIPPSPRPRSRHRPPPPRTPRARATSRRQQIAGNFNTFLQLLTTQLKNQNPLDPLDTNQFTQQLVQFAEVEQQIKSNDPADRRWWRCSRPRRPRRRSISSARRWRSTASTAQLTNGQAQWTFTPRQSRRPRPSPSPIRPARPSISADRHRAAGRAELHLERHRRHRSAMAGRQLHDDRHRHGRHRPDRSPCRPRSNGVVSSVDLTQNPPVLSVDGQNFTVNQIRG